MESREAQADELIAIEAIYGSDVYVAIDASSFRLILRPQAAEEVHVGVDIRIDFPEDYPNSLPGLRVDKSFGLDIGGLEAIEETLIETAKQEVGNVMVMQLIQSAWDWLDDHNVKPLASMHDAVAAASARATTSEQCASSDDEDRGDGIFRGLQEKPVVTEELRMTKESFDEWLREFRIEMFENGVWRRAAGSDKITGKHFFMGVGYQKKTDEGEEKSAERLHWENEKLFAGEDEVDFSEEET